MSIRTSEPMLTPLKKPKAPKKEKRCWMCGELKSWDELTFHGKRTYGVWHVCNKCILTWRSVPKQCEYHKNRLKNDADYYERYKGWVKDYYYRKRKKILKRKKKWYAENKERIRSERKERREQLKKLHQEQELQATDGERA